MNTRARAVRRRTADRAADGPAGSRLLRKPAPAGAAREGRGSEFAFRQARGARRRSSKPTPRSGAEPPDDWIASASISGSGMRAWCAHAAPPRRWSAPAMCGVNRERVDRAKPAGAGRRRGHRRARSAGADPEGGGLRRAAGRCRGRTGALCRSDPVAAAGGRFAKVAAREPGSGRPTKRERRAIDRLQGRRRLKCRRILAPPYALG